MQFYTKSKRPPVINIVSLIDILCILLIFFIVTTEFKKDQPEVEIQLPESTTGTETEKPEEPVLILVTKDKKIFVGTEEVPLNQLTQILKNRQSGLTKPLFALKADTSVPLGLFVKVMDASKEAGIANLSLLTELPDQP
ncbi:MAG: biopolymer transporter ExbD [Blastochloris sp.]|nr:biopolymer transporter ExbD [Blastochloris sp.]